jgi:phage tail sheath gpL-like
MASGAGNPDIQDVIDVLGDEWYQIIACPYNDSSNMAVMETELSSRFGPMRQIDGMYVTCKKTTGVDKSAKLTALSNFGNARNSPHVTCIHGTDSPSSEAEYAAAYAAQLAKEGSADPARPFQTLELAGILPPVVLDRFSMSENNSLLYDGISTFTVDTGSVVRIQRAISMYQKNGAGADDIAYLDVNTLLTLMYMRYDFRNTILTKYPRAKLADDGVRVGPGQQVMTPKLGKAEAIAIFRRWEYLGLAENITQFKNDLTCVRSISDPNRLEWVLPPDLINQFIVGAAQIQFLLQSPAV